MSARDEALANRIDMDSWQNRLNASKNNNLRSVLNQGITGPVSGGSPVVYPREENPQTIQDTIDERHAVEQMAQSKRDEVAGRLTKNQKLLIAAAALFYFIK